MPGDDITDIVILSTCIGDVWEFEMVLGLVVYHPQNVATRRK